MSFTVKFRFAAPDLAGQEPPAPLPLAPTGASAFRSIIGTANRARATAAAAAKIQRGREAPAGAGADGSGDAGEADGSNGAPVSCVTVVYSAICLM
jgi:hypothetical protein